MMNDHDILERLRGLGESRADRAAKIAASRLAPGRALTVNAFGMWYSRGEVPDAWRAAALDALGMLRAEAAE